MASQSCYWPDGSVTDGDVIPAENNDSSGHAACCFAGHYLFANGLCLDISQMTYYRCACTDKTWASPACPKYCMDVSAQQCGIWVCDNSNHFACNPSDCSNQTITFTINGANIQQNAALDSAITTATSSATVSSSSTPGTTSTSMSQTSSTSTTSSSSSSAVCPSHAGAYAGLGAGLGIPLIIALITLGFVVTRLRKQTRMNGVNGSGGYPRQEFPDQNFSPSKYYDPGNGYYPQQAGYDQSSRPKSELPSTTSNYNTAELAS